MGKLKSRSGEVPAKVTVEVGAVEAVQTAGPQYPRWGSAADLIFFRTGAPVLATFQPFCPPVFPGALGPQEVIWKWCEDNVRSPTGYHCKGVPKPQKILKLKTMALDKFSVLSKHDTHLLARQGSQRIFKPVPHL